MPNPQAIVQVLSVAEPVAAGLLLLRLWSEGLVQRYRYFAFYLVWMLCEGVAMWTANRNRPSYFIVYLVIDSVIWIAQTLIVLELFSLVLKNYPGVARSGRRFIVIACCGALVGAFSLAVLSTDTATYQSQAIAQYLLISRVIAFALLVFLLLILGFLFYFPIPLSRNVVVYAIGYCVYFTSRALTRLAGSLMGPELLETLSIVAMGVVVVCLLVFTLLLNRHGERVDVTVGHRWSPEQAHIAVSQLNTLNASLLKASRK